MQKLPVAVRNSDHRTVSFYNLASTYVALPKVCVDEAGDRKRLTNRNIDPHRPDVDFNRASLVFNSEFVMVHNTRHLTLHGHCATARDLPDGRDILRLPVSRQAGANKNSGKKKALNHQSTPYIKPQFQQSGQLYTRADGSRFHSLQERKELTSAVAELRLTLLKKRTHALGLILSSEQGVEHAPLEQQTFAQWHFIGAVHGLFHHHH